MGLESLPNGVGQIREHIAAMAAGYSTGLKWNEEDMLKADMMNRPERWVPVTVDRVRAKCRESGMRPNDIDTVAGFVQRRKDFRRFNVQSSYRTFAFKSVPAATRGSENMPGSSQVRVPTAASLKLRALIDSHRIELEEVLKEYGATNPRLFGSVARGDASENSDIDVLLNLATGTGNALSRAAGINESFRRILGISVDVIAPERAASPLSESLLEDVVPLFRDEPTAPSLPIFDGVTTDFREQSRIGPNHPEPETTCPI